MHSTGSFILTVLDRIRTYLDLPSSKYDNDHIVRHVLMPETVNVLSRLSHDWDNPILVRHEVAVVVGQEYYQLPPNIGQIWWVTEYDANMRRIRDFKPRGERNSRGPGWVLEGNLMAFRPLPQAAVTYDIVYTPSGDYLLHYATDGQVGFAGSSSTSSSAGSLKTFQLTSSPSFGMLDQRPNAYAGSILRVLGKADNSKNIVEERIIASHDVSDGTVTLRIPLAHYEDDDVVRYEVTPVGVQALMQAIAAASAVNLGSVKNVSEKQMRFFVTEYRRAIKTVGDNFSLMQQRIPKHFARNTVDNPDRHMWWLS